jgi:hypothetical protein
MGEAAYLENKMMVNVLLSNVRVEVLAFNKAQEELVDNLNMGPSDLEDWLVFFWVKCLALWIHRRRNWTEQILAEHFHHSRVHLLCDDLPVVCHIIEKLVEGQSFNLLGLHVAASIVEIEDDIALINLLHEQFLSSVWWHFVETGKLIQFSLTLIRDVKPRRVLALWRPDAFWDILGCSLKAVEQETLLASFWRGKVGGHCFSLAWSRDMLLKLAKDQPE